LPPAPGPRAYITNYGDGTVSVIDTGNDAVVATISLGNTPQAATVSPDGQTAYVLVAGGTVLTIDSANNVTGAVATGLAGGQAMALTRDGRTLYVGGGQSNLGTPAIVSIDTGTQTVTAFPVGGCLDPVLAPDEDHRLLYFIDGCGTFRLKVFDLATSTVTPI